MSTADKIAKLANVVKSTRSSIAKEALEHGDDLSKYYRDLGKSTSIDEMTTEFRPKTLYRRDIRYNTEEEILSRMKPREELSLRPNYQSIGMVSEPKGSYWSTKLEDLPDLISPGSSSVINAESGSLSRARGSILSLSPFTGSSRAKEILKNDIGQNLKSARLLPENRHLDASDPQKWQSILDDFEQYLHENVGSKQAKQWESLSKFRLDENPQGTIFSKLRNDFTNWLRRDYDSVTFPDVVTGQQDIVQTVLLNPNKTIGKYKLPGSKAWKYALISGSGVASAVGADKVMDVATGEGEAQAALVDLGKVYRATSETAKKTLYRAKNQPWYWHDHATKMLAGEMIEGKKVESVVHSIKNPDTMRSVVFNDGTVADVERSRIRSWIMNVGTKQYADKFKNAPSEEAQYFQAYKSLLRHFDMSRGNSWTNARQRTYQRTQIRRGYRDYLMNWESVEPGKAKDLEMYSLVSFGGRDFTMPSMYVDIIKEHQLPTFEVIETPIDFSRTLSKKKRYQWNPNRSWTDRW